jgi:hypothetical protein
MMLSLRHLPRGRPRSRWKLFALLCTMLPAALHSVTAWWGPHYRAAATGPILLLALFGMRELAATTWRGRSLGPWLAAAALFVRLPLTAIELPAHRPDPEDSWRFFQRVERRLAESGEPAVVVVDDRLRLVNERVVNHADLPTAPVLWIQDLGPEVTGRVAAAYAPRRVFRLGPGGKGELPRLEEVPLRTGGGSGRAPRPR